MEVKNHGYFHYIGTKLLIAGASLCGTFVALGGSVYHIARLDVKKAALSLGAAFMSLISTAAQTVKAAAGVLGAGHFVKEKESLKASCANVLTGYNWHFIENGLDEESAKVAKEHCPLAPCIAKTALFGHYFRFIVNGSIPKIEEPEEGDSIDEDWESLKNSPEFSGKNPNIIYRRGDPLNFETVLDESGTFYKIPQEL